jgi:DNA-binding transcriptional LysR family regulator
MVDVLALSYAVLAADLLSFSRAAAFIGVKQATLSKRISSIEADLGFRLFERTTRGAALTEAGVTFMAEAKRILGELHQLCTTGRSIAAGRHGRLAIGFSSSLASGHLRTIVSRVLTGYPDLRVTGLERDRSRLFQALHSGAIDFAVVSGDLPCSGLMRRPLWSERVEAILFEDHPLVEKERIYWPDLRRERFALPTFDPGLDLAHLVQARLGEPGFRPQVDLHEVSRDNVATLVALRMNTSLTLESSIGGNWLGVVLRDIHDLAGGVTNIGYSGYWRSDDDNPALAALLALLDEQFPPSDSTFSATWRSHGRSP